MCPRYMAMGMSYEEFWNGDPRMAEYYRKAEELKTEKRNLELWLQGMYIYEAIIDIAPVLHAFAKKGAKAKPYPSRPYPITEREHKREEESAERAKAEKAKRFMDAIVASTQKKFAQQGENNSK